LSSATAVSGGTPVLVTLQAWGAAGIEPAGGLSVVFKLAGTSGGQGTFGPVTDNKNGTYTATFTGTLAGKNTITATINGVAVTSKAQAVTVTPGAIDLARSPVTLSASSVKAVGTVTVTLQPEDGAGNKLVLSNQAVVFALDYGTSTGTFGKLMATPRGTYTAQFTGTTAGTYLVTATVNGATVTSPAPIITVTPGAAVAAKSFLTAPQASSVVSGGTTTVTLQAVDAYGNYEIAGGLSVAFAMGSTTGARGTFGKTTDNKNGTYTAVFTGTIAGTNAITATVGGIKVTTGAQAITVTPGPYNMSTSVVILSAASVAPGGTVTVFLQTKDAAGNDLTTNLLTEGIAISFALGTTSGHEGTFSSVTYVGNGEYTATFTAASAGSNTVVAEIGSGKVTSKAPKIAVT
jgi:hypothetical protein